jgi:hypothetical protein
MNPPQSYRMSGGGIQFSQPRESGLTPFYYDETSSLMNLSNSPSASLMNGAGFNGQIQQLRPSNLTAKGAVATYDRIISSNKSVRSQQFLINQQQAI